MEGPDSRAKVTGGRLSTAGAAANAFFVAGSLDASGVVAQAEEADGLMAEAARAVTLNDTSLHAGGYGAMLYAGDVAPRGGGRPGGPGVDMRTREPGGHGPGEMGEGPTAPGHARINTEAVPLTDDAPLRHTTFSATGGEIKARRDLFYVTNLRADITLDHVTVQSENGVLVRSAADRWGPLGRNGGDVHLMTRHQVLTGDFSTDVISSIVLTLADDSTLTGTTTPNVDVDMDASSRWVLTGDTLVGKLNDAAITGDSVPNIVGNGHTLTYDHRHNPQLANKTYALAGGGQLVPGGL